MRVRRLRALPAWILVTGTAVLVAVITSAAWWGFGSLNASPTSVTISRTVTVADQALKETITGTAALAPAVSDAVDFGAPGHVTAVNVQPGSTVTAGQVLGTVDPTEANAAVLNAQAALAQAQAKLSTAEASSTVTQAQIAADEATVTLDQSNVQSAQTELASTTVTSPIAGMVTAVNVAVGDVVSPTSSSNAGSASSSSSSSTGGSGTGASSAASGSSSASSSSAAFTVIATNSWQLSVDVPASAVSEVAVGDEAQLSTTENPSFFGTVASIGLLPSSATGAATYPVVVNVTGSPANLYDGVTANVSIVYKQLPDTLAVPASAIHRSGSATTVTKLVGGKDVTTPVVLGQTVGQVTQVTKGLNSGDQVVVSVTATGLRRGTGTGGTVGGTGGTGGFGGGGLGGGGFGGGGLGGGGLGGGGARLGGGNANG